MKIGVNKLSVGANSISDLKTFDVQLKKILVSRSAIFFCALCNSLQQKNQFTLLHTIITKIHKCM
jgi:hypothetical protein